ncbi:putative endopeptidase p60 precursor [Clostridium puniceum]|uniref:Putative endopeptidase p60 n=1 Tax=Clostridium puniceum TaxID=29367 RepID=A0A1S8SZA4_9CLOT|nr:C40 family peptidase [Clostridium puniceum]OOM70743.1 putative endopeptidase p60 precursor [Clostridium puniceum]
MKNKVLAIALTVVLTISGSMPVFAVPNNAQLSDSRQKYAEIENKIRDIENKIYDLNSQMESLQGTVEKNKRDIENINKIVENTKKDIEQYKKDIKDLDLALGKRLKAVYTAGDLEFNYVKFVLESNSSTELFSRLEAVTKIVGKDKEAIEKIDNKKQDLNNKIKSLDDRKNEINKLNKEVQDNLSEVDRKKREQEILANEAKKEKSKFDAEYLSQLERDAVKAQFDVIDNTNSSSGEIQGSINQLVSIRNSQIKSPIVTKEIDDKVEKAKVLASQKKVAEEKEAARLQKQAQEQANAKATSSKSSDKKSSSSISAPAGGNAQAILNEAYKHLGAKYVWGATGPETFDCSGFTSYVYKHAAGMDISRTTYTQIDVGQPVSQDQLKPGDLVFPHAGHVGIYVGNGQMIHAPQTGDVIKVSPVYSFYAGRRML